MNPILSLIIGLSSILITISQLQLPLQTDHHYSKLSIDIQNLGSGPLSEWSRDIKFQFLNELSEGRANEWIIVMGNEAGDTDSMAAAIGWAYHLNHLKSKSQKAISLLQTVEDALDLRPENQLALERASMSSHHRDILTIDELPIKPFELSRHLNGIVLVDHNYPTAGWKEANVISIIDHHMDMHTNNSANPRFITTSASCSSLVAELIFNDEHELGLTDRHLPNGLITLLLRAIALDSRGLKSNKTKRIDKKSALRLFRKFIKQNFENDQSNTINPNDSKKLENSDLNSIMNHFLIEMKYAREQLDALDLRDLLRRDWKANAVHTQSNDYPILSLGFASVPYSLIEQMKRTPEKTTPEWFAIQRAFTSEIGADVSIVLTQFNSTSKGGEKIRELVLVVAHGWGKRLGSNSATNLFNHLKKSIEDNLKGLEKWDRPDGKELLARRMVWKGLKDGRKIVMPLVQESVRNWSYEEHNDRNVSHQEEI
ncbi:hypothetical protein CROQUDRAFT_53547 [Cronartium quercuum f. sp. fusiforme G11]|uniref:DHH phosphoesterase n=1 Tax=Cronartium quercuum f. sp. fusiforme G11 TaxID=708437 RepID=A0A9P6T5Y9_9BASI|nr:hypothetical protein CROQUDRAFT_53547 [Cronartium quercuum f. sp. fusiforme G11]